MKKLIMASGIGVVVVRTFLIMILIYALIILLPVHTKTSKDAIFFAVQNNQYHMKECIEQGNYNFESLNPGFLIKDIIAEENFIDFRCGGSGFGSQTSYFGFYYTENDDVYSVWCAPPREESLACYGGGYLWEEKGGDNRYYTEKICDHFYYYEASF